MTKRKTAPSAGDPIFAAIERHRITWEAAVAQDYALPRDHAAHAAAHKKADAAIERLMETVPTTLAGVAAAIAHFVKWDEANFPDTSGEYMKTLLRSPALAAGADEGRAA